MEQIRAFVAIELDEPTLSAIGVVQGELQKQAPARTIRWVHSEGIHLTLKFLGNVPANRIPAIIEGMREACQETGPFAMTVGGLGCFPTLRRPSVVWIGVQEPTGELARLQKLVEERLDSLGFPPEGRPFSPHLTLGRVKREARPGDLRVLGELIGNYPAETIGKMQVDAVALIRSDLKPDGAVYTRLAATSLSSHRGSEP
jgi:2'-5' RNA ligase